MSMSSSVMLMYLAKRSMGLAGREGGREGGGREGGREGGGRGGRGEGGEGGGEGQRGKSIIMKSKCWCFFVVVLY